MSRVLSGFSRTRTARGSAACGRMRVFVGHVCLVRGLPASWNRRRPGRRAMAIVELLPDAAATLDVFEEPRIGNEHVFSH